MTELKEIIKESLRNQCEIAEAKGGSPTGRRSWTRRARSKAGPNFKSHDTTSLRGDVINPKLYKKNPELYHKIYNEETEQLDEKLKKGMTVKQVIDDFQKSDDPRFKGDSQEQRRKRAIAAWYKLKNEENEQLDEISGAKVGTYIVKARKEKESAKAVGDWAYGKMSRARSPEKKSKYLDTVIKQNRVQGKRGKGIDLATRKLLGGEKDLRTTSYDHEKMRYDYKPVAAAKVSASASRSGDPDRMTKQGLISLRKSIKKEETEQLDELSDKTLDSYNTNAKKDLSKRVKSGANFNDRKVVNREGGLIRAKERKEGKLLYRNAEGELTGPKKYTREETELDEGKSKKDAAYNKFWAHDPKTGEKIKEIGKKERAEKKAFASAKREINSLKKQGK